MKRRYLTILALLLALALVFAGCGGNEDISGTIAPNPDGQDNPLSLGAFEGGVYTNKYLALGCALDSNWTFASAEDLQELPSGVADALEGSDIGDMLADATQIMDMQANNATDLTTMNILLTKLSLQERLLYLAMSEEDIVDSVLAQSDMLTAAYAQAGIDVTEMKKVTVDFLGEEHFAIWTDSSIQGMKYYILQLYDYSRGQYSATITLASYVEDNTASLLELFHAAN